MQGGLCRRQGETTQKIPYSWEHHRIHYQLAQDDNRRRRGIIGDIHYVPLPLDCDIVDTRMPCQGPAHVHHSQATEQAVDLQRNATPLVRFVKSCVNDDVHVRSHPQIA